MKKIPILGELTPGKTERHLIKLPGAALANDEPRAVVSVTGGRPGRVLFVNAGVHGGEYPAIEAVIRLGRILDPREIAGSVILMPALNLPAFRSRTPFVCPIDNVNPNRVFPGDPNGTYSEQMVFSLINEFVVRADAYIDLHGGDIPEALVPFVICRSATEPVEAVNSVEARSKAMAMAFGLPYVLAVSKPVQPSKGLSSYAAAAEKGIPAILAEAGGVGQMQQSAVALLVDGVVNVMRHLEMVETAGDATAKSQIPSSKSQGSSKFQTSKQQEIGRRPVATEKTSAADTSPSRTGVSPTILTKFEWLYMKQAGLWYPRVAAGDHVQKGKEIGTVGNLFGDTIEKVTSPVTGTVLFLTINPSVLENGLLMGIGVE
jgi:predicted deacylase